MASSRRTTARRGWALAFAGLLILPLMGCAGQGHIFRKFDIDSAESLSVDARQRMVLVTHRGGKTRDRTVVCAEPSPDVFAAQAANAAANASLTQAAPAARADGATQAQRSAAGSASGGMSEVAASIAMRTQTIQLLRDGLFRACEAFMNGAIDQHQYNVILLNIDKLMITLMGVDAIGGTASAPPVAIAAGAGASDRPAAMATGRAATGQVQSEAVANVVQHATGHSSLPALCVSLLASGELRIDNPGQHALLARCDQLLAGSVNQLVAAPRAPEQRYRVSESAAGIARPAAAETVPPTKRPASWLTSIEPADSGMPWRTKVSATGAPVSVGTSGTQLRPLPLSRDDWQTHVDRHVAAP